MFARNPARERGATVEMWGLRIPRKTAFVVAYAFLGVVALIGPDLSLRSVPLIGRRLDHMATICIDNIYINSEEDAVLMPPIPQKVELYVPTSIAMCYEWIRRDALSADDGIMQRVNVLEHRDVCLDWTSPHYSMMEIIASSILNTILTRVKYRHACPTHRAYEEKMRGYDWSTIQTVFQEPAMAVNQDLVLPDDFKDVCKMCLAEYNDYAESYRVKSRSLHHCFAFPANSDLYKAPLNLNEVNSPTKLNLPVEPDLSGNIAPISSITKVLRTRLWHSAAEWNNVTDHPPNDYFGGTVILIDNGSYRVPPSVIADYIKPSTTSITIIAGPLCYTANLPTGQSCMGYGEELRATLAPMYDLPDTGFEGGPGVTFQISASTAGTFSRAILADNLICPPNTVSCLLPAMGKKDPTESNIMECSPPCPPSAGPFFDKVGTNGNTNVFLLPPDNVDPPVEGLPEAPDKQPITPPPEGVPLSPSFPESQVPVVGDAFNSEEGLAPPAADITTVVNASSSDVYKTVEDQFPAEVKARSTGKREEKSPLHVLPNVLIDYSNEEHVPTPEEVDEAVDSGEPLNVNTPETPASENLDIPIDVASGELATDADTDLLPNDLDDENLMELAVARRNSKDRIVTGYDGNYLFEVPCPSGDEVGGVLVVDDGYAITDNNETVVVSDGTGTVTFESPVTVTTVPIVEGTITDPVTGEVITTEIISIVDPILNETVNVTASGIISNPDSSLSVTNPVGTLIIVPETQHGVLVTMGSARNMGNRGKGKKGGDGKDRTHTIIEGTVISTGNENIPPSTNGAVVMDGDGSLAITATDTFLDCDPEEGNTGDYQQITPSPLASFVQPVGTYDKCLHTDFSPPIHITNQFEFMVVIDVYQTFKGEAISWVAVDYPALYSGPTCQKLEEVEHGKMASYPVACVNGLATVDIYIHDGSKKINQDYPRDDPKFDITSQIPDRCEPSQDLGNKCFFRYEVTCTPPTRRLGDGGTGMPMLKGRRKLWGKENIAVRAPFSMTPKNVIIPPATRELKQIKFAEKIIRNCPDLGRKKIFDRFQFGGKSPADKLYVPSNPTSSHVM